MKKIIKNIILCMALLFMVTACTTIPRDRRVDYTEIFSQSAVATRMYGRTALDGGTKSVDNIDYNSLVDGDLCIVITDSDLTYFYRFESSSALTESSPHVITPDDQGGNGRWLLTGIIGETFLGGLNVIEMGTGATYTLSAANSYGTLLLMTDTDSVTTVQLPDYQATPEATHVRLKAQVCVMNLYAQATIIAPSADDKIRTSDGTLQAAAATVTGPATVSAYSCYVLTDAASDVGHWSQMGLNGLWPVTP